MGFLLVEYPTDREVFIDGDQVGRTKVPIEVANGLHEVRLGTGSDYSPQMQTVEVLGDPYDDPKTISFAPR
jgi:hypothetical protein